MKDLRLVLLFVLISLQTVLPGLVCDIVFVSVFVERSERHRIKFYNSSLSYWAGARCYFKAEVLTLSMVLLYRSTSAVM